MIERYEEFWRKVDISKSDDCWEWQGRIVGGYGHYVGLPGSVGVHRISYTYFNGPIPIGLCVLHECDNPRCVRPDHLWLGTKTDNARDRDQKGRKAVGERINRAKLTADQVIDIRKSYAEGGVTTRGLGLQYGIDHAAIWRIIVRQRWAHVQCATCHEVIPEGMTG